MSPILTYFKSISFNDSREHPTLVADPNSHYNVLDSTGVFREGP